MKKSLLILSAIVFSACFAAAAYADGQSYMDRPNSIALKVGYHIYENSDFFDFFSADKKDFNGAVGEISYQRNLSRFLALEAAGGFFSSGKTYTNSLPNVIGDNADLTVTNYYISPSIKLQLPANPFRFYVGAGPDYYYSLVKISYGPSFLYDNSQSFNSFGYHGLAGMEVFIYKNPSADGFSDAPVSLLIEYKYSKVTIKGADENFVRLANVNYSQSYPSHDLDVGGHTIMVGLRWNF